MGKTHWVIVIEGEHREEHRVESYSEAARIFMEAVEKGAKRVAMRRVEEYPPPERLLLRLRRLLTRVVKVFYQR